MANAASFLADGLEHLLGLPFASSEDLAAWDVEADRLHSEVERRFPEFKLQHFLYHFFNDADIRVRDAGYRERQEGLVREYIERLRTGDPEA